ncbi:MAG: response regulator transcription factor [Cyclobacteriaceae bacterium]|nr:response regulator transcription factor [Cyclobacteriaceae bacterium]
MNVLIVEDESLARERLAHMILQYDEHINIIAELDSIEDTVNYCRNNPEKFDLAFFDIQLSDGLSFEIFKQISFDKPVIFTTAYDSYALKAFKVNSIDYLLKPIDYKELCEAISKYKKHQFDVNKDKPDFNEIRTLITQVQKNFKKRFIVKFGDHIQFKPVEDIAYIYADGKTVYLVSKSNQRKYIIDHTLDELENELLNPDDFFRINRKFILKLDSISDVRNYVNSRLKIFTDTPCEADMIVSRDKVSDFKAWLNM